MRAVLLFAVLQLLPITASAGDGETSCFSEKTAARVNTISPHGDIELSSGQRIVLADIALPDGGQWRLNALHKLNGWVSKEISIYFNAKADRWNRHRATATFGGKDIASELVGEGLALVDPGEAPELCNRMLQKIERQARQRRAGLWSDRASGPFSAQETEVLLARVGQFSVVEGRILNVGIRKKWVYLNFSGRWKQDFTATISSAVWARMQQRGLSEESLKGNRVEMRGVIRNWNGPSLEIMSPDLLELIADTADPT